MNKKNFFAAFFVGCISSFAQVGINTTTPKGALDVVSANSGIIFPRVANTDAVIAPVNGMVIYDEAEKCLKVMLMTLGKTSRLVLLFRLILQSLLLLTQPTKVSQ